MYHQTVKLSSFANKDIETASNCSLSFFFVGFRFHFSAFYSKTNLHDIFLYVTSYFPSLVLQNVHVLEFS